VGALSVDQAFLFAVARDALKIATSSLASARSALSFVSGIRPASERSSSQNADSSVLQEQLPFWREIPPWNERDKQRGNSQRPMFRIATVDS
jgi:hypothetical protein